MTPLFSHLVPATFPALALAHFLALLSPGPDFFLILGHAARHRLRGTLFICLGIALGNAFYICLAISGWSVMRLWPQLYRCVELAGAAYLAWLGYLLLRASRQATNLRPHQAAPLCATRQLLTGLGSALLNPKNAIFYLTLMTVIMGPAATLPQQAFAGAWMTLLVFAWDAGLAAAISLPGAQRALEKRIPFIECMAGLTLMGIAAWLALRTVLG